MLSFIKNGLSLKTQVFGLIIVISLISFCVRIITDIDTTRKYLQTQMASHAQDTATSLGLSISPYLGKESIMVAKTMATAIFDSGYYKQIKFTNSQNEVVFNLIHPNHVESVPTWFIHIVELNAPSMQTELNNGWIMAGTLEVTTHVGQSYLTLWEHTKRSFYGAFLLLAASLAIAMMILRAVFKPLIAVENQAHLVTRKRFTLTNEIPIARELRTVTRAINNMVMNLQSTFESLTKQMQTLTEEVYQDPLTGLGNRKSFNNYFNSIVYTITNDTPVTAMMITLPSLARINKTISYQSGDEYVNIVAGILKSTFAELTNARVFRLNGSTFIALAPYDKPFLKRTQLEISDTFSQQKNSSHANGFANFSLVSVDKEMSISALLTTLDIGNTVGDSNNKEIEEDTIFSVNQWRLLIKSILSSGEVNFSVQPVKRAHSENKQCYLEVFTHFLFEGEKVNNGHLFAMAEKLNLTQELDKKIIRSFVILKEQYPNDVFALNLSRASLYSSQFIEWLRLFSHTKPILKTNLLFELHEISLLYNVHIASQHIDIIKDIGINVCVEHFGTSLTSFRYLQGLDIEYVKIDGSYIQDLLDNSQSQFFIQTVNNICHGFGIKVLACLVENHETLLMLENLGCDGIQGNMIMPPSNVIKNTQNNMTKQFTFSADTLKFCNRTFN